MIAKGKEKRKAGKVLNSMIMVLLVVVLGVSAVYAEDTWKIVNPTSGDNAPIALQAPPPAYQYRAADATAGNIQYGTWQGLPAYKIIVRPGEIWSNGNRAELKGYVIFKNGTGMDASFKVWFPSDFRNPGGNKFWQVHGDFANWGWGFKHLDWGGNTDMIYPDVLSNRGQFIPIERGRWIDFRVLIRFSTGEDGYANYYKDGILLWAYKGATMDAQGWYMKQGLYRISPPYGMPDWVSTLYETPVVAKIPPSSIGVIPTAAVNVLKFNQFVNMEHTIYTLSGRLIYKNNYKSNTFFLHKVESGIYFASFKIDNQLYNAKFISAK